MREHGVFHRFHRKYIQTTDSEYDLLRSPNLLQRHFDDFGINEAWCVILLTSQQTRAGFT